MAAIRPALGSLRMLFIPWFSGFRETCFAMNAMSRGLVHYARQIGRVIDQVHPAAMIADFSFAGAMLAAEWRRLPYVAVYLAGSSFTGPGIPPFGSGLPIGAHWGAMGKRYERLAAARERALVRRVRRARRRLGLDAALARRPLGEPLSPYLNLIPSAEVMEAPRDRLPRNTCYIGPCVAPTGGLRSDFPFHRFDPSRSKIYASLGTVFTNRLGVFRRLIAAFADGRHQLIVSAGRAYGRLRSGSPPSGVLLFERVPQVALLPRVDLVISHGGNNTVNESLMAGKPLLVLPVGGEQADNASRVVYLGAGLRADVRRSSPAELRALADRLLCEPGFRARAQAIAAMVARTEGAVVASRLVQRVAATGAPVERPDGCPLTLTRELPPPWGLGQEAS